MFVSSLNLLTNKKLNNNFSFKANPEPIEKAAAKVADNIPVKKIEKGVKEILEDIFEPSATKDFDDTFAPGGPFDSDMINYP